MHFYFFFALLTLTGNKSNFFPIREQMLAQDSLAYSKEPFLAIAAPR